MCIRHFVGGGWPLDPYSSRIPQRLPEAAPGRLARLMTKTGRQLAALIAAGTISAEEHARAALYRIADQSWIGAFVAVAADPVLEAAREVDRRRMRGENPGALAGLLFALKDNINVSDLPTTACTPALVANIPRTDAEVVARLKAAGAIVLGKATMHELAMGGTSSNPHMPPVRNPRAPDFIAGGSSGGSAAAIAAGFCEFALGSDTGGSVPIPSSLCGIAGLRPSVGRYPVNGLFAANPSRDVIGPMAMGADDLRLIDSVIAGQPECPLPALDRLRIGLPYRYFWEGADETVQLVLRTAVEGLAQAGVTIVETEVENVEPFNEAVSAALRPESSFALPKALAGLDPAVTLEMVKNKTHSKAIAEALSAMATRAVVPEQIAEALGLHRPRLRDAFTTALARAGADALLVPATPLPAVPLDSTASLTINGREVDFFSYTRATLPAANAGLPFLSIPVAYLGILPLGLGLIGRHREDASLLAIGAAFEAALGGGHQSAGRYGF